MTEVRGMASGRGEAKEMGRKSTLARPRPEHQSGLRRSVNSAVYVERWCVLVSKLREIVGLDSLAEGALLAFSQWEVQRSRLPLESFPSSLYLLSAAAARGVNVRRYMEFVLYDMYFPRRCSS